MKPPARLLLLLFALLAVSGLEAQYNEREILSQQAYQFLAQRQFGEAERLFRQVLEQFPDDANSVLQLLNIYFQTSQLDKADALLKQYRRNLSTTVATEQEILLLVMQGQVDSAWSLSQAHLQQQNHSENSYRVLASYFERRGFYEQVLQLYRDARVQRGNPELFRLELANAALNYRRFDTALQEYLAFLDKNPANLYFINNQCKTILSEDPRLMSVIGDYAAQSGNEVIRELYANALVAGKDYNQALDIYKNLSADKLIRFAEEQYKAANDEVALPAFAWLAEQSADAVSRNDYRLRQALILIRGGQRREADTLLQAVIADSLMQERSNLYRKGINLHARIMLAENTLALSKDVDAAQAWYNEARRYANNILDQQELDLALVRLHQIRQDYQTAAELLDRVSEPTLAQRRDYLRFGTELLRGNTEVADSLMNELVIRYPEGLYVNDAIYLMMFALGLQGAEREDFFSAYRMMLLQDPAAVDSLASLFERTQDEELLTLAIEWAILLAEREKAGALLEHVWQDGISAEYAALLRLILTADREAKQRLARDFLKANPESIFAPKFRQNLSRLNSTRPQF